MGHQKDWGQSSIYFGKCSEFFCIAEYTVLRYVNPFTHYLKHEQEFFIGYKTRGEAERLISDKARTASFLYGLKKRPVLYPSYQFIYENNFQNRCFISREIQVLSFRKLYVWLYHI